MIVSWDCDGARFYGGAGGGNSKSWMREVVDGR